MSLQLCLISPDDLRYRELIALRQDVLRTPLGLSFTPDQLAAEKTDLHIAALYDGEIVGTLVLTPLGEGCVKFRQMAAAPAFQRRGIGARLLAYGEDLARQKNWRTVVLHARLTAQGFYARHGYKTEGDVFVEVTLPHIRMVKTLSG